MPMLEDPTWRHSLLDAIEDSVLYIKGCKIKDNQRSKHVRFEISSLTKCLEVLQNLCIQMCSLYGQYL